MAEVAYAVVDLETTGLEAQFDVPLEIAVVLTDEWGGEIGEPFTSLILEDNNSFRLGVSRGKHNHFVDEMHHKSGLWRDLNDLDRLYPRGRVDAELCGWLEAHGVEKATVPMMGNSIGSLDRPFCITHLPKFNAYLSYRNVDISSFKEVCRRTNPVLYENMLPIVGTKEDATHRALDDARASIREYRAYLDEFLITSEN
jgi:oligoribonuclease (3'-5' exoribonuclease)